MSLSFQEFLAESMKDPEFAAAYKEVSEEESKKLLVAALVEVARMKPVVEAAVKWRAGYGGSVELIRVVDAYEKGESQ